MTIHTRMCAVMDDIGTIAKNERNTFHKFQYRGIDTVYNQLHGVMAKHGVFSVPVVLDEKSEERKSKDGKAVIYRVLKIKYVFYAEDGTNLECVVIGEGMDSGDKASNKAMAVAHKYALLQAFCIPTEEKKDPDADSHEIEPKQNVEKDVLQSLLRGLTNDDAQINEFLVHVNKIKKGQQWQSMTPAQMKKMSTNFAAFTAEFTEYWAGKGNGPEQEEK